MISIEKRLFHSAKLKIERADHHIKELARLVNSFSHPNRYRLIVKPDPKTAVPMLKFEMLSKGIDDIPLIVGDAVHNLRTALDHLVCELVTRAGKDLTNDTRFAFWQTRKEAVTAINGIVQGVSLDVITSFLEYVQPYKGGNWPLLVLHALDIADKHRLIVSLFTFVGVHFTAEQKGQHLPTIGFSITRREKSYVIQLHPNAQVERNANLMLQILFDEVEGLENQPVIPTLHYLREIVSSVVQEIEKAVLASKEWFSL